jgi:hypothetical protein
MVGERAILDIESNGDGLLILEYAYPGRIFIPVEAFLWVEELRNGAGILIASRVQDEACPLSFLFFLL